jgi:hypothetical protein
MKTFYQAPSFWVVFGLTLALSGVGCSNEQDNKESPPVGIGQKYEPDASGAFSDDGSNGSDNQPGDADTGETSGDEDDASGSEDNGTNDSLYQEPFEDYSNTTQMADEPGNHYVGDMSATISDDETIEQGQKALLYEYANDSNASNRCGVRGAPAKLRLGQFDIYPGTPKKVWIEVSVRFSPNFTTLVPNNGGAGVSYSTSGDFSDGDQILFDGGGDSKTLFASVPSRTHQQLILWETTGSSPSKGTSITANNGVGGEVETESWDCSETATPYRLVSVNARNDFQVSNCSAEDASGTDRDSLVESTGYYSLMVGGPGGSKLRGMFPSPEEETCGTNQQTHGSRSDLIDGQWHDIRMEIITSSQKGTPDGQFRLWIDNSDVAVVTKTNMVVDRSLSILQLGDTRRGAYEQMEVFFDDLKIWSKKPGWVGSN